MKKKVIIILLSMVMVLGNFTTAFASEIFNNKLRAKQTENFEEQVNVVQVMRLIEGNETGDLLLEDGLTRAQGVTVYTRLLGLTREASKFSESNTTYQTGLTDIPAWASKYTNYLFNLKLVNGVSKTEFGSNSPMTAAQFTTMVLRGLGYDDKLGDFSWDKSLEKALEIGMITEELKQDIEADNNFTRGEMVQLSYNALFTENKSGVLLLSERQKTNLNTVTGMIYTELTEEEISEIYKTESNEKYVVFSDNPDKQLKLFVKIKDMTEEILELPTVNLNGKKVDIKIDNVSKVFISDWDSVIVYFKDGFVMSFILEENKLINEDDREFILELFSKIVFEVAFEKLGDWGDKELRMNIDRPDSGELIAEIKLDEKPALAAHTTNMNVQTLTFDIITK